MTNDKATAAGSGQAGLPHLGQPGDPRLRVQVANQVVAGIGSGRYDGRVPPEAALAASLGVGRKTVRRAYKELEAAGVVRAVHGVGWLLQDGAGPGAVDPRAWMRVAESLQAQITAGELKLWEMLPPVGVLATGAGCTRLPVTMALAEFGRRGAVRRIPGRGYQVLPAEPEPVQP